MMDHKICFFFCFFIKKCGYCSLPKTANTLNIRTLKIIAKDNLKWSLKSRTVANFQKWIMTIDCLNSLVTKEMLRSENVQVLNRKQI